VDAAAFGAVDAMEVDPAEPYAANGLLIASQPVTLTPAGSPASSIILGRGASIEDHEWGLGTSRSDPRSPVPDPDENHASVHPVRTLRSHSTLIYPASFPRTRAILEAHGIRLEIVDVSELQNAEGAVTCCSIVFEA
jgi:hypothetical protein